LDRLDASIEVHEGPIFYQDVGFPAVQAFAVVRVPQLKMMGTTQAILAVSSEVDVMLGSLSVRLCRSGSQD
jgi:hypothetical protein